MKQSRRESVVRAEHCTSVVVPFPVPRSEVGLVTALRAGHADAVRVLCERHSGELLRVAARILGPDELLASVVAEAVQRSLQKFDELREPRTLRVWLVSRVIAAARRRLRARRCLRWIVPSWRPNLPPDGQHYSELLRASYRVLDRMNDDQRIVFCLVVIHSMSLAEAARVMGVSLNLARSLLEKACRSFARCCESEPAVCARRLCLA